jgi:hypothetical protein
VSKLSPSHAPLADDLLIGAQQIADELGIDLRQCFHWLQNGYIPATKTGSTWTTTRSRLRRHFDGDASIPDERNRKSVGSAAAGKGRADA